MLDVSYLFFSFHLLRLAEATLSAGGHQIAKFCVLQTSWQIQAFLLGEKKRSNKEKVKKTRLMKECGCVFLARVDL